MRTFPGPRHFIFACCALFGVARSFATEVGEDQAEIARVVVRVALAGEEADADFQGNGGRVLQAAVDYAAGLGGGTVKIAPGRYLMRNTLQLHDDVRVVGTAGKTILARADGCTSLLASTAGTNERQVTVADASAFRIGDGVMVQDEQSKYGFAVTQATITARLDDNTFQISRPLVRDYAVDRRARLTAGFPVVGMWNVRNAVLEGIVIEGNSEKTEYLTGCRGGGIYLFECQDVVIRNCIVRDYNGDGISFQTTRNVVVEDCVCTRNRGVGLHPGCGTERATVRRVECSKNGGDGLFLCWRVKHSLFADCRFRANRRHGISIGLKDSDNLFRRNQVTGNTDCGVFFRHQPATSGAHRNRFESNRIVDNGSPVKIAGAHHDLVFRQNTIGTTQANENPPPAIATDGEAEGLEFLDNKLLNIDVVGPSRPRKQADP